jgi:bacillithiol synthase
MRHVTALEAFQTGSLRALHRLEHGDFTGAFDVPHGADRAALSNALMQYLESVGAPKPALENAKLLAHPESRVVMTGQQAGLLLGPAYTISKAVNAILLARQFSSDERPVLPVFWVASQDHDADEVRTAHLLDLQEHEFDVALELPQGVSLGRVPLQPAWLETVMGELDVFDAPEVFKKPILDQLERTFKASSTWSEWFARLVLGVLGSHGLIVVDPMHSAIAPLFASALRRELEQPLASSERIESAVSALEAAGVAPQLRRAAGATNLFITGDDGQRRLLRFDGQHFHADRAYTLSDLERVLEHCPERLTPAAGLRPVIADLVFPTAVNVVGPGELAYHIQLLGVYQLHGAAQPLLHPRLSMTILEPPIKRILGKYNLTVPEFRRTGRAELERRLLEQSGAAATVRTEFETMMQSFERMESALLALEPGFSKNVWRAKAAVRFQLENKLPRKLGAALARADGDAERQFARLEQHLMPLGKPQERVNSFLEYLMKFGPVALERVLQLEPAGEQLVEI